MSGCVCGLVWERTGDTFDDVHGDLVKCIRFEIHEHKVSYEYHEVVLNTTTKRK